MRLIKIILITIVLTIISLSFIAYGYNKTLGKNKTDCMIEYINNHYPKGATYLIDGKYPHIDKRGMVYMQHIKDVEGCYINDSFFSFIYNTPYCLVTLNMETYIFNN